MSSLKHSLHGSDLGHLQIIARLWGLDFNPPDARTGLELLIPLMLGKDNFLETINAMPLDAQKALKELSNRGGKMPWANFCRRYGEIREMGSVRRDREMPYLDSNALASESLWHRGLIGRAFFDTSDGPVEFVYVPNELMNFLAPAARENQQLPGRIANPSEYKFIVESNDGIVDDACTILAGLRNKMAFEDLDTFLISSQGYPNQLTAMAMKNLLFVKGLCDRSGSPLPEPVRQFLELDRKEAGFELTRAWLDSHDFNELKMLPDLAAEGEWKNDPLAARQKIIAHLSTLLHFHNSTATKKEKPFWNLASFVEGIRQMDPDFQRSTGDYDGWFLLNKKTGKYLRGFETWEQVEGELIRFIICGPLHWLGIIDLGYSDAPKANRCPKVTSFRFSKSANHLLSQEPPDKDTYTKTSLVMKSDGRIYVHRFVDRSIRYQIARFCEWDGNKHDTYLYHLSPASLRRAQEQGLSVQHLIAIITKFSPTIPPNILSSLRRWESEGSEAHFENVMILRVNKSEIIQDLRSSRANRYLGEQLGQTAIIIRSEAWKKVAETLTEMGILSEGPSNL